MLRPIFLACSFAAGALALAPATANPPQWQICANEGARCTPGSLPAEVRYGEPWNDRWSAPRAVTAPLDCGNATFGDPSPGTGKRCEWRAVAVPPPAVEVEIRATWSHAVANVDGSPLVGRLGYRIERAAQEAGPWAPWATVAADATSATGKAPAGRSCLRVSTLAPAGESAPSAAACVERLAPGAAPLPPSGVGASATDFALVSGSASGTRAVYARTSAGSRGSKIGDLAVGPSAQSTPAFARVRCSPTDVFVSGNVRYARVIDPRAPEALRAGYVSGCVNYGRQ